MHTDRHGNTGVNVIDYYAYTSNLRGTNAAFKAFVSVLALTLCIVADNLWVSAFVITTMACITVFIGKLSVRNYFSVLRIPILFMIMGSIAIALDFGKLPLGDWNLDFHYFYICIASTNLFITASIFGKAMGAISAMYMLTLSTPANEIIMVLRKVHVPKLIIELMHMIYRFLFVLLEVQCKMHYAAESRLGYVDYKTAVKTFGGTVGNLLLVSLKKANTYYDALESRGYEGELLFWEERKDCKIAEVMAAILYFALLVLVWMLTK